MNSQLPLDQPLNINAFNTAASFLQWLLIGLILGVPLFFAFSILSEHGRTTIVSVINTFVNPHKINGMLMISMLGLCIHHAACAMTVSESHTPMSQWFIIKPASVAFKVITAVAGTSLTLAFFSFNFWEAYYLGAASITAFIVCSVGALSIPAMFKSSRLAVDKNPLKAGVLYGFLSVLIMMSLYTELHSALIG